MSAAAAFDAATGAETGTGNRAAHRVAYASQLADRYRACREATLALVDGLSDADLSVQSAPQTRPGKWHLAHTTRFFQAHVLADGAVTLRVNDPDWDRLFGENHFAPCGPWSHPGLWSRPALQEVLAYRRRVDEAVAGRLVESSDEVFEARLELGLQHEQQHQEWLLADLLHLFAQHPLRPVYRRSQPSAALPPQPVEAPWVVFRGGRQAIGHDDEGFAFDREQPRHEVLLRPFALSAAPVDNRAWLAFMADGGYRRRELWLADGWRQVLEHGWSSPAYWAPSDGGWVQMTLAGELPLDAHAPVCHVSWFEADAFARWAGKRLPTEAEWEVAAQRQAVAGNFADSARLRPAPLHANVQAPLRQLYGDVWEWTASAFGPYPGFRAPETPVGQFDGRFGVGRFVLRGGSCATPMDHLRASYRHRLPPDRRWHFSGLRLAEDRA